MSFDYVDFYNFSCDYNTNEGARKLNLYFYPRDNSLELYDLGLKRLLLKRSATEIRLDDLYVGSTLTIFGKIIKITDYGNADTRKQLGTLKQNAFLMIKPEARNFMGQIIGIIEKHKMQIKNIKMLKLQPLQAVQYGTTKTSDENVAFLLENLTSGPIIVLEVLGENAIETLKRICGPEDVLDAKKNHPFSLRAEYGIDMIKCGVFNPQDVAANQKDLDFFFPKMNDRLALTPKYNKSTLCLIKPHAIKEGKIGAILNYIIENEYSVTAMKMFRLERKQCEDFYEIYKGVVGEYSQMVTHLVSGSCLAIEVMGEENIQQSFRTFCGPVDPEVGKILRPTSIRAKFGVDKIANAVHCTDLHEDTLHELEYFFKVL